MRLTSFQTPEMRDSNDLIIQRGTYGKKTPLTNKQNTGIIDYINNNLMAHQKALEVIGITIDEEGQASLSGSLMGIIEDSVNRATNVAVQNFTQSSWVYSGENYTLEISQPYILDVYMASLDGSFHKTFIPIHKLSNKCILVSSEPFNGYVTYVKSLQVSTEVIVDENGNDIVYTYATKDELHNYVASRRVVYTTLSAFPTQGTTGITYIDATNKTVYEWNGTAYYCVGSDFNNITVINGGDASG